jgi:hypothetical protein
MVSASAPGRERAQLHDERFALHHRSHLGEQLPQRARVGAELRPAVDVGARHVQLDGAQRVDVVHHARDAHVVVDGEPRDGADDGAGHLRDARGDVGRELVHADVRQPDGVEHRAALAPRVLRGEDAPRRVALAGLGRDGLGHDAADGLQIKHVGHLVERARGARRQQQRVAQGQASEVGGEGRWGDTRVGHGR